MLIVIFLCGVKGMTISFLLWNSVIKGEEEEDTKKKLCKILSDNGAESPSLSDKPTEITHKGNKKSKIFTFEIKNIDAEKSICDNIKNQETIYHDIKTGFKLRPEYYHGIKINGTSEFIVYKSENEKEQEFKRECEKIICEQNVVKKVRIRDNDVTFVELYKKDHAELLINSINDMARSKSNSKLNASFTKNRATTQKLSIQNLYDFYQKSDYDLVTKDLKIFITEICKLLN
ncbi:hypothetical protein NWP30_10330 [Chrysosporum ovalisporum CS-1034]|uniref:hypothetical protein n=1 Tax=Umezakia ovalisporum TaxID=75695 RepID=UPI0024771123|nr:hypothetical protein [Umezakia ovalisporum]MDH6074720.1 hypothetical protein [Umezakia ovalisporum CS-1034]